MKFNFVTVVWGSDYVDLFMKAVIPGFLSLSNFGSFKYKNSSKYYIYTTNQDGRDILSSESYALLKSSVPVEMVDIESYGKIEDRYVRMSLSHAKAIQQASVEGANLIVLPPDEIWSGLSRLADFAEKGKRLVMVEGTRVIKERFVPLLGKLNQNEITSRDLVRLAMENLHPISERLFWEETPFESGMPSMLYWRANDGSGILSRCFHLHPLLSRPRQSINFQGTIDDDFVQMACEPDEIEVVTDSDVIVGIEMSKFVLPERVQPFASYRHLSAWAVDHANSAHRNFFRKAIYFHSEKLNHDWQILFENSNRVVVRILLLAWVWEIARITNALVLVPIFFLGWVFRIPNSRDLLWMKFRHLFHALRLLPNGLVLQGSIKKFYSELFPWRPSALEWKSKRLLQ